MIITTSNIVYYLLEQGLVTSESVVDGDFIVVDVSRRNRNFKVIQTCRPSYFVKQIQSFEPQAIAAQQCEANCYSFAQNNPDFAPLAPLLPKYYAFDSSQHILILDLLLEGENLTEYHHRLGKFPLEVATQLGQVLATYHRELPFSLKNSSHSVFSQNVPWILSVHQQSTYLLDSISAANSQILDIIQKYPEFDQTLNTLQSEWQVNSLIHGDIKWDNCIVYTNNAQNDEISLKIVDWELADFGDFCWDVGAIFQAYISFWILSMQITPETSLLQMLELAQYPLEEMQPAIQTFWNTYINGLEVNNKSVEVLLERSVKYCAARMIQTTYEYMADSPQINANALCLLQVSLNILNNPREAISHLLGM